MITAGKFGYNFFEEGKSKTYEHTETDHQKIKDFLVESGTQMPSSEKKSAVPPSHKKEALCVNKCQQ